MLLATLCRFCAPFVNQLSKKLDFFQDLSSKWAITAPKSRATKRASCWRCRLDFDQRAIAQVLAACPVANNTVRLGKERLFLATPKSDRFGVVMGVNAL